MSKSPYYIFGVPTENKNLTLDTLNALAEAFMKRGYSWVQFRTAMREWSKDLDVYNQAMVEWYFTDDSSETFFYKHDGTHLDIVDDPGIEVWDDWKQD